MRIEGFELEQNLRQDSYLVFFKYMSIVIKKNSTILNKINQIKFDIKLN